MGRSFLGALSEDHFGRCVVSLKGTMKAVALLIALNVGIVISFPTGPPNGMPLCMNLMQAPPPLSPHVRQEGNGTLLSMGPWPRGDTIDQKSTYHKLNVRCG